MTNRGGNSGMLTGTSSGRISIASSSSLRCKAFTCVSFSLISKCISRAIHLVRKVNLARAKIIARREKNVKMFFYYGQGWCKAENKSFICCVREVISIVALVQETLPISEKAFCHTRHGNQSKTRGGGLDYGWQGRDNASFSDSIMVFSHLTLGM